jgi:hypothetical protein
MRPNDLGPAEAQAIDIGFLDFVYILSITIGLFPELLAIPGLTGILSQEWVRLGIPPSSDARFNLGVLLLGLATIGLSWFGYHRSLTGRPYKYSSALSMFRFLIDIVLLVSYTLLLIEFKNLSAFLFFLVLNYGLYLVWDIIKIIEFKERRLKSREVATLITFVLFVILWLVVNAVDRWAVLLLAALVTFSYRLSKVFIKGAEQLSQSA